MRPAPLTVVPAPEKPLQVLAERRHAITSVRGFAQVAYEQGEESVGGRHAILARAPEVIIEIRSIDVPEGPKRDADIAAWRSLASLPAVRSNRIHFLTGRAIGVPGPRVAESAEQAAALLHPELQ